MERLQKVIANSGYCSRRKAEELILQKKVSVNGQVVTELGTKISGDDVVEIDGQMLNLNHDKVYYLLNKPRGVISSSKDEKGRTTVVDLINCNQRIYPVGRLDYDTTGLIILTNDGELANKLMHPRNNIPKTYLAKLAGIIDKETIDKLKKGVVVDGRKVKIIDFKIKKKDLQKETTYISITIIEGRNHIIKNLFKELGYLVDKLTRTHIDFLEIGNLGSGEYRVLSTKEVKRLYSK
ncbi:MAG: rRNA pseudouridine synthase [Firmicutes bacterium]|nr:rRNA pseudouridine synthase [Bacillota bacterium]